MFDLKTSQVYFRDQFVDFKDANVSVASSPMLYGLAVYSVFTVKFDPKSKQLCIFRLQDHYKRLCDSSKIMDFTDFTKTMSYKQFEQIIEQLLLSNKIKQNVLVRVTLFIDEIMSGTKMHGLTTSMAAFIYPMAPFYANESVDVCVSSWTRTPDNSIPPRAKVNGSYANASLMKNEALLNGYDEAIALDSHGHVTEGTVANIFMVRSGVVVTPDLATDILEGVTRDTVLKIAGELGIPTQERSVDRSELYIADELFYSGSSAHIVAIKSVDKRPITGDTSISSKISDAYNKAQLGQFGSKFNWVTKLTIK